LPARPSSGLLLLPVHGVGRACRGDRAEAGAAGPGRHRPLGRGLRVGFTRDRLSNTATRWRPPRAVKYPAAVPHRGGVKHSIGVLAEPSSFPQHPMESTPLIADLSLAFDVLLRGWRVSELRSGESCLVNK